MAINTRTRSTRSGARGAAAKGRPARRGAKTTSRARAGDGKAAQAHEGDGARGSRRTCEAPGCGKTFRAYVARQRFCSNGCRSRAFYWDFKDRTGERYAAHLSGAPVRKARGRGRRASRGA